jgi:biotin operon repressor
MFRFCSSPLPRTWKVTDGGHRQDGLSRVSYRECQPAAGALQHGVHERLFLISGRPGHAQLLAAAMPTVHRVTGAVPRSSRARIDAYVRVPGNSRKLRLRSTRGATNTRFRMDDDQRSNGRATKPTGSQSALRALEILDAIAERPMSLPELAEQVGLSRPTCYRLATALAEKGLLATSGRNGYCLGPRLAELAEIMRSQSQCENAG